MSMRILGGACMALGLLMCSGCGSRAEMAHYGVKDARIIWLQGDSLQWATGADLSGPSVIKGQVVEVLGQSKPGSEGKSVGVVVELSSTVLLQGTRCSRVALMAPELTQRSLRIGDALVLVIDERLKVVGVGREPKDDRRTQ